MVKSISLKGLNEVEINCARREAVTLSSLSHPHIIGCIESFCEKTDLHIVCEYADSGDLDKYVLSRKASGVALSEGKLMTFFVQLCLALAYMHRRRTLHRDLKLANIFLDSDGCGAGASAMPQIKVGDLGIARALKNTQEMAKTVVGTPYCESGRTRCQGRRERSVSPHRRLQPCGPSSPSQTSPPKSARVVLTDTKLTCGPQVCAFMRWLRSSTPSKARLCNRSSSASSAASLCHCLRPTRLPSAT